MTLINRKIECTFEYGTGPKGDGPPIETTIKNARISLNINTPGGAGLTFCNGRIYGMDLSLMNTLSRTGPTMLMYRNNILTVKAGDDVIGLSQIFKGTVLNAWPDMISAPEVSFLVSAIPGFISKMKPSNVSSYPGSVDAAVILGNLAAKMNVKYENNGVSVILSNQYLHGDLMTQAKKVVKAAQISWNGCENGVMAIWPKGGTRKGDIVTINSESGMIGYPAYTESGVTVKSIFNPRVRYGQMIKVVSDLTPTNATYELIGLQHDVECLLPGGRWETTFNLRRMGNITGNING